MEGEDESLILMFAVATIVLADIVAKKGVICFVLRRFDDVIVYGVLVQFEEGRFVFVHLILSIRMVSFEWNIIMIILLLLLSSSIIIN